MPLPILGHHNAAQIRMTSEVDAEEIEDLPLVEVGGGPDRSNAVERGGVTVETNYEAQALFQRVRKDVVRDLKPRLRGVPVNSSDIFEEVITSLLRGSSSGENVFTSHRDGQ